MQIIETVALISINGTLIAVLISFLIFLFIISRVMLTPLKNAVSERHNYIHNINEDIKDARKRYKTIIDRINDGKAEAKKAAWEQRKKLELSAEVKAEAIISDAKQQITGMRENIEAKTASLLAEARKSLAFESEIISAAIIDKMLGRRLGS